MLIFAPQVFHPRSQNPRRHPYRPRIIGKELILCLVYRKNLNFDRSGHAKDFVSGRTISKLNENFIYVSIISCNGNLMKFDFFSLQLWDCLMSFFVVKTSFRKERQKSALFLEPFGLGPVLWQGNSATLLYVFDRRLSTMLPLRWSNSVELILIQDF